MSSGTPKTSRFGIQAIFLVLFAVLCGIAGVGMRLWRQAPPVVEAPAAPPAQFRLVLAAADLLPGREIRASDFYTSMVGKEEYKKVLQDRAAFGDGKQLIGRLVRKKVEMNRPFPLDCVFPEGTGPTPADLLSEGMRAVTVKMNLVGGIRGFVAPESWVDVLFRRSDGNAAPGSTEAARTHTVFPGVRVLAIQDSLYPETVLTKDTRGSVAQNFEITLELTPQQCEVLKSIEDRGDLTLNMLPKQADRENLGSVPSPEVMELLLGVEEPKPVVVPPFVPSVRLVRGGAQSSVVVDHPYDLVIDQQLYPAPDVPASGSNSVPSPDSGDSGPASGSNWPQAIPPVRKTPSTSDASVGTSSQPGVEPLKADEDQKSDPVGPQPSRGTRATPDTIFAQRAGRVVYPGNASTTVATPVRRAETRVTGSKSTQQASSGRRVMSSPVTRPVQAGLTQVSGRSDPSRKRMVGMSSAKVSGISRTSRLPAMASSQSGHVLTGTTSVRGQNLTVKSHEPVSVPGRATAGRSSVATSTPARPAIRSYASSNGPAIRRSTGGSTLVPLASGARSSSGSSLAYSSRSRSPGLPELKIGRR